MSKKGANKRKSVSAKQKSEFKKELEKAIDNYLKSIEKQLHNEVGESYMHDSVPVIRRQNNS